MNTMNHGGYTAASSSTNGTTSLSVASLVCQRSIISFRGETVAQLRRSLQLGPKDHLRDCEQKLSLQKPASGKLLLRCHRKSTAVRCCPRPRARA